MAPVCRDHEIRRERAAVRVHPGDAAALQHEPGRLGLQAKLEATIGARVLREEVEEIPLRDHRDERIARTEAVQIDDGKLPVAVARGEIGHLGMRQPQERLGESQLVQHLQRRGMDGVAAEVTQEIRVLLEHRDAQAGTREQQTQHHPCRPAAGDQHPLLHTAV